MDQFTPNRLYEIKDCHIYAVFYNRKYVTFMEMENTEKLIPKSHERYYRKKWRLTYDEAVALTTQLGAETGSNRIFARKILFVDAYTGEIHKEGRTQYEERNSNLAESKLNHRGSRRLFGHW